MFSYAQISSLFSAQHEMKWVERGEPIELLDDGFGVGEGESEVGCC